jgi:diadenosine tetraphosphate (Ap4A) HIT family hydrolase
MRVVDRQQARALLDAELRELGEDECVGCALVRASGDDDADGSTSSAIAHNTHGLVLLNRYACRQGHLTVIAREHAERVQELPWQVYGDLQRLAHEGMAALQEVFAPVRIYTAVLGSPAPLGMTYPHVHVHVVPVMESDERARPARVFSWSEGVVVYGDDEAKQLAARIRAAWPSASR